jgi:hypothetical protein
MQDYYKMVSREQARLEPLLRWVIGNLALSGQLNIITPAIDYRHKKVSDYEVNWNSAFELSEQEESEVELRKVQANQAKLDYMTIDEVRAECDLPPLPDGKGKELKTSSLGLFNNPEQEELPDEEVQKKANEGDKFLVVDLTKHARSHKHA